MAKLELLTALHFQREVILRAWQYCMIEARAENARVLTFHSWGISWKIHAVLLAKGRLRNNEISVVKQKSCKMIKQKWLEIRGPEDQERWKPGDQK